MAIKWEVVSIDRWWELRDHCRYCDRQMEFQTIFSDVDGYEIQFYPLHCSSAECLNKAVREGLDVIQDCFEARIGRE